MVSHDREQVRRLADRVTWIDRTVRADGAPDVVLAARAAPMLEAAP
jgi:ABC-type Mn2+/Zn2+ transport system ATPase subunit